MDAFAVAAPATTVRFSEQIDLINAPTHISDTQPVFYTRIINYKLFIILNFLSKKY